MEKRIKSFTQFFESSTNEDFSNYAYSVFIEAADDYGYPIFVLRESGDLFDVEGNLRDAPDIDDLFDEYMDADHGPMSGPDSFGDLVSSVEEYLEEESEENLESIDGWLSHLGLTGIDPKRLADSYDGDNTYWNETVDKFHSNMRVQFDGDYFGELEKTAWNFLILSAENVDTEVYSGEVIYNVSPRFNDFFETPPFNLCYNNDSDNLYTWVSEDLHKHIMKDTGLMKNDLKLPILELILKILGNNDLILLLDKNFLQGIRSSELYNEIIQRLQGEGKIEIVNMLKGGGMLGRFGVI